MASAGLLVAFVAVLTPFTVPVLLGTLVILDLLAGLAGEDLTGEVLAADAVRVGFATGGSANIFSAPGVGMVVHCQLSSISAQA